MKLRSKLTLILTLLYGQITVAGSNSLLNQALDDSYQERESMQKVYKKNSSAQRPKVDKSSEDNEISIDVGDELGGGGSYAGESAGSMYAPRQNVDRSFNLDSELDEVNADGKKKNEKAREKRANSVKKLNPSAKRARK